MNLAVALGLILLLAEIHLPGFADADSADNGTSTGETKTEAPNYTSPTPTQTPSSAGATPTPTPSVGPIVRLTPLASTAASAALPPVSHISAVRNYNWVVALIVLASLGILTVVGIEFYIQVKIYGSPLTTDCSSQWLGHVLLFGIFLSYLLLYAFIPYPCPTTCAIIRFCVGVCYALCFGVVVVKLALILCPVEVYPGVALVLLLFVWAVQIVVDVQWLIQDPPEVARIDNVDGYVCDPGFSEHVKSLVYVMALIVCSLCACAVARCGKSDGARADVIWIGLSCGFTTAVWIAWILLGYLKDDSEYHDPCLAFGLLATATVLLVFIFVPKIRQLNRIEEFALEAPDDDVIKQEVSIKTEAYAGSIVSGSKRSTGSIDGVSSNGGYAGNTLERGNGRHWNARTMDTLVEDDEFIPPEADPFALHLQYPTRDAKPRWGSIHSGEDYQPHAKRPPSTSSKTSEANHPPTVNHHDHVNRKVNGNNSLAHTKVNHNPKPSYSYEVRSSLRKGNNASVNHNHNPRSKQSRY